MKKIKFSNINRRHITLLGLVIIIAVAGYININYSENTVETLATVSNDENIKEAEKPKNDIYESAIMERDSKRSQSMEVYRDIIDNSSCDAKTKENAQKMLTLSAKYINDENAIEENIRAKGIDKSIVYINENEVSVIVYEKKLDSIIVAQIKDIITKRTDFSADKIKIVENK